MHVTGHFGCVKLGISQQIVCSMQTMFSKHCNTPWAGVPRPPAQSKIDKNWQKSIKYGKNRVCKCGSALLRMLL